MSTQVGSRAHWTTARRLHLQQLERPIASAVQQPSRDGAQRSHRCPLCRVTRAVHAQQRPVRKRDPCADVWMQGTHNALQFARRSTRIEQTVLGADLLGVCNAILVLLGKRRRLALREALQRSYEQLTAELLQARRERSVCVLRVYRLSAGEAHRPAVETRSEAHDRYAGVLVAGHD